MGIAPIVFDGTTCLGEALVVIVRFVDSEWNIKERLIALNHWQKVSQGKKLPGS